MPRGDHLVWIEFVPLRADVIRGLSLLLGACGCMQAARSARGDAPPIMSRRHTHEGQQAFRGCYVDQLT